MGKRTEKTKRRLEAASRALDIPEGLFGGFTMEINSNREAVLMGDVIVDEYDEHAALLRVSGVKIRFSGDEVTLSCLTPQSVKVMGQFSSIEFL